jgi:hypothetical protein
MIVLVSMVLILVSPVQSAPSEANALTGYYNLLGYEGIGTLGSGLTSHGPTPPVADYVTTHCRYINVPNTTVGQYYLRYPLDLPNGANITKVSLYIADFHATGSMWAYLRSRKWNSRQSGTTLSFTLSEIPNPNDKTINMNNLNIDVDNATTEYWIDVSPQNSASPGQLCVYGIQVTYTIDASFLPLIQKGY